MSLTITSLPTPPARTRPSTFSSEADAFLAALPTFRSEANALASEAGANAAAAESAKATADGYAIMAQQSASAAAASCDFKGAWSALTGAHGFITVSHNGQIWRNKASIANITAQEPGVHSNWLPLESLDVMFKSLAATSFVYDAGVLASVTYATGHKVVYTYSSGNLSNVKYYNFDGATLLATNTFTYTNGVLTANTWS